MYSCLYSYTVKCFAALRWGTTRIVSRLSHTPCTKVYVLTSVANPSLLYLCCNNVINNRVNCATIYQLQASALSVGAFYGWLDAVPTSPPIIILCANKLVENEQVIIDSMNRWLTLVQNQCTNLKGKAHVIVVGSHADTLKEMGEDSQAKEGIFAPIIKSLSSKSSFQWIVALLVRMI